MKRKVDICVLSDIHLGSNACQTEPLLGYLQSIQPNVLVLNGDFIEYTRSNRRVSSQAVYPIIQEILDLTAKGTKIYYVSGKHDKAVRRLGNRPFLNIHLRNSLILQLQGKKHLFLHGDLLEVPKWLKFLLKNKGSKSIYWRILYKRCCRFFRSNPSQSSSLEKMEVLESNAIDFAKEMDCDFVICGHTHRPRMSHTSGITYLNAGDWIQHCSALEYYWGKWTLFIYESEQNTLPAEGGSKDTAKDQPLPGSTANP